MNTERLTQEFEGVLDRARAAIDQEITRARKVIAAADAEKTSAQSTLADLQTQLALTKDQLKLTRSELQHSNGLAGVGHDIEKARSELQRLKAETEEVAKALEKATKELTAREAQVVALGNEAQRMIAIRVEGEAAMAEMRSKLAQVTLGRSA